MTSIAVVTPWLDHRELAEDYFAAVVPELTPSDELIVVDDGSNPMLSFARLRLEESRGFCGASNAGLRAATTDAVLFLNNDVELARRGWLDVIREAVEPGVLVGQLVDHQGTVVDGTPYPFLGGWCFAGMRADLLDLDGFDEELAEPAYYSDNILCLEARAAGMTLLEVPIGLRHKLNTTAGPAWDDRVRAATKANRDRYEARVRELTAVVP